MHRGGGRSREERGEGDKSPVLWRVNGPVKYSLLQYQSAGQGRDGRGGEGGAEPGGGGWKGMVGG